MLPELLRYKRNTQCPTVVTTPPSPSHSHTLCKTSVQILESPRVELDDDMLNALGL